MAYSGCRTCLSVAPVVIKKSTVRLHSSLILLLWYRRDQTHGRSADGGEKWERAALQLQRSATWSLEEGFAVVHTAALDNRGNLHAEFLVLPAHRGAVDVALTDCT